MLHEMQSIQSRIALREVRAVVDTARFLASSGGGGDELRERQHVLDLPAGALVEKLIHHVLTPEADDLARFG